MRTFHKPRSRVIQQGDNLYTILGVYPSRMFINTDKTVDKTKLGMVVRWEGGDHVIQHQDKYYVCEQIEDAIIE